MQTNNSPNSTRAALVSNRIWLLWKAVPRFKNGIPALDKSGQQKIDKIPYYANGSKRSGKLDTPNDRAKLVSYVEAETVLNNPNSTYAGLAIALGKIDNSDLYVQGVDLDDITSNRNDSYAEEIAGYFELSPSEKGAHAIGIGRHFKSLGSNGSGVEAYAGLRFFTYTGITLRDTPVTCLADYVEGPLKERHTPDKQSSININEIAPSPPHPQTSLVNFTPLQHGHVSPSQVNELRSALNHMPSDDRGLWIQIGMSLYELGTVGRELWLQWSSSSEKHRQLEDSQTWDSFKNNDLTYKTVFFEAQERGWTNPNSNAANLPTTPAIQTVHIDTEEPTEQDIEYLDDPYIPKGLAIGFFGRGESGKSTIASTIVARNSHNYSTLWITSEESPEQIKLRHIKSGGCKNTIGVVDSEFCIYQNLIEAIEAAKAKMSAPLGFVVLDACVALVTWGKGESSNDDSSVKRLLKFINKAAQDFNISIIVLGHTNKGRDHIQLTDAVNGSTAWTNSVRLAYMVTKIPDEEYMGTIQIIKGNTVSKFLQLFKTEPVYRMKANCDGYSPVLCKAEFNGDRVYGGRNIMEAIADEFSPMSLAQKERARKLETIVDSIFHSLNDGTHKTRADIANLISIPVNPKYWMLADEELKRRGVTIETTLRNKRTYQRNPTLRAPSITDS